GADEPAVLPGAGRPGLRLHHPAVDLEEDTVSRNGLAGIILRGHAIAARLCALDERERRRATVRPEGRPVPEHRVAVLQLDLVGPDRRRYAVDLEDPARRGLGGVSPDLVDVWAEGRGRHVVVELARDARRLERLERCRAARARLVGA